MELTPCFNAQLLSGTRSELLLTFDREEYEHGDRPDNDTDGKTQGELEKVHQDEVAPDDPEQRRSYYPGDIP